MGRICLALEKCISSKIYSIRKRTMTNETQITGIMLRLFVAHRGDNVSDRVSLPFRSIRSVAAS